MNELIFNLDGDNNVVGVDQNNTDLAVTVEQNDINTNIILIEGMNIEDEEKEINVTVESSDTLVFNTVGGIQGPEGRRVELQSNATHLQWRYINDESWKDLVSLADITGPDGPIGPQGTQIEVQSDGTYIQWRYEGDVEWINLVELSTLEGPPGTTDYDELINKPTEMTPSIHNNDKHSENYLVSETDPIFNASEASNFVAGDKNKLDNIEANANNYVLESHGDDKHSETYLKSVVLNDLGVTASATELNYTSGVTSAIQTQIDDMWKTIYPVGAIYTSVVSTSPATLFGGTWSSFGAGRVLVGYNGDDADFNASEKTGGAKTHTLLTSEMPSHTHIQNAHNHTASSNNTGAHTHHIKGIATRQAGTWNGFVGSANCNNISNDTGMSAGNHSHTITVNNITPTNQNTGDGTAHNNIQPYITVYMWKRTA